MITNGVYVEIEIGKKPGMRLRGEHRMQPFGIYLLDQSFWHFMNGGAMCLGAMLRTIH